MDAISKLREMGASEDDILGSVLDVHPEHRAAAQELMKSGASPKDVVDSIGDVVTDTQRSRAANQSWGEWGLDLARGAAHGLGSTLTSLGETASRPDASKTSKSIGDAAQSAGATVSSFAGPDYHPSEARISDPRTYWDAPKAIAEQAPGIAGLVGSAAAGARVGATAGLLGGPLAEVTVPVGTVLGGLTGAGLYAFYNHWGAEAAKVAEDNGRSKPTQADFDASRNTALAQAGIDSAAVPLGGMAGRAGGVIAGAVGGTAGKILGGPIKGATLAGTAGQIAGRTVATDAALAASAAGDQIASDIGRGKPIDTQDALDAADKAAVVGTGLRATRAVGQVSGAMRFRDAPDPQAIGRVVDHMSSDAFPGDVQNPGQLRQNIAMGKDLYNGRVSALADQGLDPAIQETMGYLRKGAVLDRNQLAGLKDALGDRGDLFEALRDQNAMNYLSSKSSDGKAPTGPVDAVVGAAGRLVGDKVAHAAIGGGAAALGMANPTALAAVGGAAALSKIAGKVGAKALGLDGQFSNPLGYAAGRFGGMEALAGRAGEPAPVRPGAADEPVVPAGPQGSPAPAPAPGPRPVGYAPPPAPQPSLAEALGVGNAPPRPMPRPPMAPPTGPRPVGPADMVPMNEGTIIENVAAQAKAENRPFLDVLHEHHRSSASIAQNPNVPRAVADHAAAERSQIWRAIQVAEANARPEEIQRARSSKQVQGIAPDAEVMIEPTEMTAGRTLNSRTAPTAMREAMEAAMATHAQEQQARAAKATSERAQAVLTRPKKVEAPEAKKASTKSAAPKKAASGSRPRTLKHARGTGGHITKVGGKRKK